MTCINVLISPDCPHPRCSFNQYCYLFSTLPLIFLLHSIVMRHPAPLFLCSFPVWRYMTPSALSTQHIPPSGKLMPSRISTVLHSRFTLCQRIRFCGCFGCSTLSGDTKRLSQDTGYEYRVHDFQKERRIQVVRNRIVARIRACSSSCGVRMLSPESMYKEKTIVWL